MTRTAHLNSSYLGEWKIMMKKLTLTLGCLALLASLTSMAQADAITFGFVGTSSTPAVSINASGVTLGPATLLSLTDTNTNNIHLLPGTVFISTGSASSFVASGGILSAQFNAGSGVEVEVDSASCVGGSMPGVCIQGSQNSNGAYVGFLNSTGSFQALFHVDYVSPYVTSLFSQPNQWLQPGSDSFTTSHNSFANGGRTDTTSLGQGGITFQTPVPEPGTLAMIGSGMIGLATVLRRKISL